MSGYENRRDIARNISRYDRDLIISRNSGELKMLSERQFYDSDPAMAGTLGRPLTYAECLDLHSRFITKSEVFGGGRRLKIAVLRNITIEPLSPVLVAEALRSGFSPDIHVGDFDSVATEAFDSASALYAFQPDIIIIFQWLDFSSPSLSRHHVRLSEADREEVMSSAHAHMQSVVRAIRVNSKAVVLVANAPLPPSPTLGILDAQLEAGHTAAIIRFNADLGKFARDTVNVYILDLMSVLARLGWEGSIDLRMSALARAPFSQRALCAIGDQIGRFFRALYGKTRKCLVLDCDNTLWGGIVGEDGSSGVKIGSSFPGLAYRDFQEVVLNLASRGVLLAVASKNNHNDVMRMFCTHDEMLLREEHFAAIKVNWNDKVQSLREIAKELNIGLDSLVFVDDSGFEIENIRSRLPEVATIHLSSKPVEYASLLAESGLFDSLSLSSEDRGRTTMYAADRKRAELAPLYANVEDYLASLNLIADIDRVTPVELSRVFQLMQKTNQFNMTTRRLSEGELDCLISDPKSEVLRLRARDKVSDLGLVGVAILRFHSGVAEVSDFLMSCRALGRGIELAFISRVVSVAFVRGATSVRGNFVPTAKNALCNGFYEKAGFLLISRNESGETWEFGRSKGRVSSPAWIAIEGVSL
jgi:FkbH-like protein